MLDSAQYSQPILLLFQLEAALTKNAKTVSSIIIDHAEKPFHGSLSSLTIDLSLLLKNCESIQRALAQVGTVLFNTSEASDETGTSCNSNPEPKISEYISENALHFNPLNAIKVLSRDEVVSEKISERVQIVAHLLNDYVTHNDIEDIDDNIIEKIRIKREEMKLNGPSSSIAVLKDPNPNKLNGPSSSIAFLKVPNPNPNPVTNNSNTNLKTETENVESKKTERGVKRKENDFEERKSGSTASSAISPG
jgi:hypothetical protein